MPTLLAVFLTVGMVLGVTAQSLTTAAIANAKESVVPITRSIDSIFLRLPSESDLEQIIFSADSLALVKLVQTIEIKGQEIPCDAMAVYSDQVIGMIKVVLERKNLTANQLKAIIQSAEAEISRIQKQLQRLENDQKSLRLSSLRSGLEILVAKLDGQYMDYNKETKKLPPLQAEIEGYKKQIQILETDSDETRTSILQKKIEVTQYETDIKKLEQQLIQYRESRQKTLADINIQENRITTNQNKIADARNRIANLNRQIARINARSDEIKKSYTKLEIEVQRLRTDVSIAVAKEYEITQMIQEFKDRLAKEEDKLLYREEESSRAMAVSLSNVLPSFLSQNEQIYYDCFGDGNVQEIRAGSVIVYMIRGERLPVYLNKAYDFSETNVLSIDSNRNIRLDMVNVFGGVWSNTYGPAFSDSELIESSAFAKDDFTCLNPSQVESGSGRISWIQNNIIQLQDAGNNTWRINVGACSRIESTEIVPKKGQQMVFKGIFLPNNEVNLYSAVCF